MARPKAFDPGHALERAVEIFWEKGYEGAAMSDLVGAMGIARQSLYDTFGDKRELFQRAVAHYCRRRHAEFLEALAGAPTPLAGLRLFIGSLAEPTRGCLLVNTLAEFGQHDEELAGFLRAQLARLEEALREVLERARDAGELDAGRDLDVLAATIANGLHGLALLHRIGEPAERLRRVVDGILETIATREDGR